MGGKPPSMAGIQAHWGRNTVSLIALELLLLAVSASIIAFGFRRDAWRPRPSLHSARAWCGAEWTDATTAERWIWIGILAAALLLRLYHIDQPMRHDEAYTYLGYASLPLVDALSVYRDPNNHLFHTLLVWLSTRLFGTSPAAIRLPAFVAGMLIVPMTYVVARRFADRSTSLLAMALAAVWPELVLYSTNARGHAIVGLAFLVLLVLGDRAIERDRSWDWLLFAVVIALGMYTAPTMIYPAGAVMLWLLAEAWRRQGSAAMRSALRRLTVAGVLAAVLTAMCVLPVVVRNGLAALVSNRQVAALWGPELVAALREFARDFVASSFLGIPLPLLFVLTLLGIIGVVAPGADRSRRITLVAIACAWSALLIVGVRRPPPGRVLQFIVPLACVYIAMGVRAALAPVARGRDPRFATNLLACVVVPLFAANTVLTRTVFRAPESGTLVDAPQIAEWLLANMRPGDQIAYATPSGPPLDYYLVRMGGRPASAVNAGSGRGRVFVVVNSRHLQTLESVQRFRREFPWNEMVPSGAPVSFAAESVFVFRYASGEALTRNTAPTELKERP